MLDLTPQTSLDELQSALDTGQTVVVTTSGSTGDPKRVALSAAALEASARASAEVIGEGNWYLCLPLHYVAGVQVVNRARLAGTTLLTRQDAPGFAEAVKRLPMPRYTSVVPAQLQAVFEQAVDDDPLVAAAGEAELGALALFSRILVGGQQLPDRLARRCRAAGMNLVCTYGSSETAGGCVYDGVPLPGVRVATDEADRIRLAGPMLAEGYLTAEGEPDVARTDDHFSTEAGIRWLLTDDRGRIDEGQLRVLGRIDDVIISGGLKLDLTEVQVWLDAEFGAGLIAFPVASRRWGQRLGLFVPQTQPTAELEPALTARFGVQARPRILSAPTAPLLPNGKPDRQLLASMVGDE